MHAGGMYGAFAVRTVIAIGLVALAILVWQLHDVLLLLFGAILIAVILDAAVNLLCRFVPLPKGLAIATATVLIAGILAVGGMLFGQEIGRQLSGLSDTLPGAWQRFADWIGQDRLQSLIDVVSPGGGTIASIAQTAVGIVTATFSGLVLAILGGIYLAADPGGYRRGALLLLPRKARGRIGEAMHATGKALRNWLLGQLVSMTLTFVAVFIGLAAIGVPSALALAIVAGLLDFIPLVGPFLGAIPALLIALTGGLDLFLWTAGFFLFWQQVEGNALAPLVMRFAVSIPPAVTLFALFTFGGIFGIVGVLLGGPLTVATWVMVKRLWVDPREEGLS